MNKKEREMLRFFLSAACVVLLFSAASAEAGGMMSRGMGRITPITPYGDYCNECTAYGAGREVLPPDEAVKALERYYGDKGCQLGAVSYKGRFVEVDIYKNGRNVDKVLFDRKTGRIRSIY
jgi:hypothetical protein